MLQYIREVTVPFVGITLAIRVTEAVTAELEENAIHFVIIPASCSGELRICN